MKKILSLWPFAFIPMAIIYVYITSYLGLDWLCAKSFHEPLAFPIVGMSIISFSLLAYKTKNELALAMVFLNTAFFLREWHFAGTNAGIYIAIVIFLGWFVYRRDHIEKMISGKRIKVWLFATALCYLFSQLIARRVFASYHLGLLPMEGLYFTQLEETQEGMAHILMFITSIIAWQTFYFKRNTNKIQPEYFAKRAKVSKLYLLAILIVFLISGLFFLHYKSKPYHFEIVKPGVLYRSGWMKSKNLNKIINTYNIQTVVNLCVPNESTYVENYKDEQQTCQENNVKIVYIPMPGHTPPSEEQIDQWLNLLGDNKNYPILVHCAQGAIRTAAMVAVYQMEFDGKDNQKVLDNLETFGHTLDEPKHENIYKFIHDY